VFHSFEEIKYIGGTAMRIVCVLALTVMLESCAITSPDIIEPVNSTNFAAYANFCEVNYAGARSAESVAVSGFASVEQQCGGFFDKLSQLTEFGRFSSQTLTASNLAAQSILQAARVAAESIVIVSASATLTQAIFNAFVQQYAFSPYLFKIRELTWQAFDKHRTDNVEVLSRLKTGYLPDDYCDAAILIQQHASICTLSSIQGLFDQQVARPAKVINAGSANNTPGQPAAIAEALRARRAFARPSQSGYVPIVAPNFIVK
jgi:hypothetical protein